MSECIVLGTDECDAEVQRDLWLKEHPGIKINRVHPPKRESPNLLTRFGSKKSLRVSILIDYELPEAAEYKEPIDIAERFKELQQLRIRVYKAELDFSTTERCRTEEGRWVREGAIAPADIRATVINDVIE
jgi:hypothetical protein